MTSKSETRIPVSCNKDCGAGCPLLATVERGRVTKIRDNPLGSPYMHGCVRGFQMPRVLYAPDRLRKPLLRTGPRGCGSNLPGQFKEVPWPQALDVVAERLAGIKARYGDEAILHLGGSGSCRGALHNTHRLTRRFLSVFGGYTETYWNYSTAAAHFVTPYVLGTQQAGIDAGTLQFSSLIILWGADIADTRLGCEMEARIREARARGGEVIVIDPRRTATAARLATRWIPVRPGTDTALMMAVLYVLIVEGLINTAFVEKYSTGFDELRRHVLGLPSTGTSTRLSAGSSGRCAPKTPRWAEAICGTPAETIRQFARQYGRTHPAALIPGPSIQRTIGGEEAIRMAIALQVATGNLGILGGSSGALAWGRLPYPRMGVIGVHGCNQPPGPSRASVPVYRWPDAVLEGREGGYPSDIKAIYNVGGNLLVQGSDVHKNIRAFEEVEFAVCHDYFLTPTAQYCDVVLPATTFLERNDIVFPDGGNYLLFSNQAVPPLPEARNDYDIFCGLADRLGFLFEFSEGKSEEEWLESFVAASEVPDYETFKRTGIYMGEDQLRVGLSDFIADPQAHPLNTPSGRVQIFSAAYAGTGYSPIPECRVLAAAEEYPLRLITPHPKYRIHSQYDNIPWFRERQKQALWIHPHDAGLRGIEDGQQVCVSSPEGRTRTVARVTGDILAGVVCLPEGAWPSFEPDGTDTSGSANVLTSTVPTEPSQGSRTHSVLVEVARM
jgi:anaerobic dimethyl sulfoxide reductase subunit A